MQWFWRRADNDPTTPTPSFKPLSIAQLEAVLNTFDYEWSRFSLEDFVAWLAAQSGLVLRVRSVALPEGYFGAWMGTDQAEYFFHADHLQGWHRTQVILHELAHWLLLHSTQRLRPEQLALVAAGGTLELHGVPLILQRSTSATTPEDVAAERLAALILARATSRAQPPIMGPRLQEFADEW